MAEDQEARPVTATIRMYKGILGDCFLLRLSEEAGGTTILIDCGVLQGVPGARERMAQVAEDIVRQCGGSDGQAGRLDLLVVTHGHWDHISGFSYAKDLLLNPAKLSIGELWLAWTEKDGDPQVDELKARFEKRKKAVAMVGAAAGGAGANPFAAAPEGALRGLQAFIGPVDSGSAMAMGSTLTGDEIVDRLKSLAGSVRYLEPGDVVATPGEVRLRTYVLGPPRNEDRLFQDLPTPGTKETYMANRALNEQAILAMAENRPDRLQDHSPFAGSHRRLTASKVRNAPAHDPGDWATWASRWLKARYYRKETPCRFGDSRPPNHRCERDPFCRQDQQYRRIDGDWLGAAGSVALKLDSDTNNTSLVLAFELPGGDILLFAADAQVGNWLSWHDQPYLADGRKVTAEEILARTVLYKVGHHGSRNATGQERGLAAMTHSRLAAMIPIVEQVARKQGRSGWQMPFPKLKEELLARTSGRMLRGDAVKGEDADGTQINDDPEFLDAVEEGGDGLWVEYRLSG
jgi:Metallo-beta-lactamase superfamily